MQSSLLALLTLFSVAFMSFAHSASPKKSGFGGRHISQELFEYIRTVLPEGSTLLEFGSGWGSSQLAQHYTLFSVEHDAAWVGRYDTHYIYAPIKNGWYDRDVLEKKLPKKYDLILIDGPQETVGLGRVGFLIHFDLFRGDVPIVFDDVNRPREFAVMVEVARRLGKSYTVFPFSKKSFGVVQ